MRRAILDKWTQVPDGATVGYDAEQDAKRFTMTESGIAVVPSRYPFEGKPSPQLAYSAHFPRPGE